MTIIQLQETLLSILNPKPPICDIVTYRYALELVVLWVCLPVILGLVYLWRQVKVHKLHTINRNYSYSKCIVFNFSIYRFRSARRSTEGSTESTSSLTSKTWLLLVVHSNLTCYLWVTYYVIDNLYGCTKFFGFPSEEYDPRLRAASISGIGVISLGE